jgi:hypothetical protein
MSSPRADSYDKQSTLETLPLLHQRCWSYTTPLQRSSVPHMTQKWIPSFHYMAARQARDPAVLRISRRLIKLGRKVLILHFLRGNFQVVSHQHGNNNNHRFGALSTNQRGVSSPRDPFICEAQSIGLPIMPSRSSQELLTSERPPLPYPKAFRLQPAVAIGVL